MDEIRQALLPVAGGTAAMLLSTALTILGQSKLRYAVKDENKKNLLAHPYKPWIVPEGHEEGAEKAYRGYKAYLNCQEWFFMSLPGLWLWSFYAPSLPYVTQQLADFSTVGTVAVWVMANHMYFHGYVESADKRITGFRFRTLVFRFWAYGSMASIFCATLRRFGFQIPA